MATETLRLFASAREIAGAGTITYEADTTQDLLARAEEELGVGFSEILQISRIWLNGEPVEGNSPITDGDEVAVLPPVSGG